MSDNIFSDIDSHFDDNYDPYDDKKNDRIPKCKFGTFFTSSGYCCDACYKEEKQNRDKMREDFFTGFFDSAFNDKPNEYNNDASFHNVKIDPLLEYYKILQLIPPKTREQIRKQYIKLSLKLHPDKNNNSMVSVGQFQELNNAYHILIEKIN